jgi:hypothetical protein
MRDMVRALIIGYLTLRSQEDSARKVFNQEVARQQNDGLADAAKGARNKALKR